jgi:hypothetical protein
VVNRDGHRFNEWLIMGWFSGCKKFINDLFLSKNYDSITIQYPNFIMEKCSQNSGTRLNPCCSGYGDRASYLRCGGLRSDHNRIALGFGPGSNRPMHHPTPHLLSPFICVLYLLARQSRAFGRRRLQNLRRPLISLTHPLLASTVSGSILLRSWESQAIPGY